MMYTVKQLADLTGITVRTLHYYDEIGLLTPSARSDAEYRLYQREDLLRLQQILLYRALDFPLAEIHILLEASDYDLIDSLIQQRQLLEQKQESYTTLLDTIDKTIADLQGKQALVTDAEIYEGFTPEQITQYNEEAISLYGQEAVAESQRRVRSLTKDQWQELKEENEAICQELAKAMDQDPASEVIQGLVHRHRIALEAFASVYKDYYLGLSDLYITDPRFRAHYDTYADGLADVLSAGMKVYADKHL